MAHLCSISEVLSVPLDVLLREPNARVRGLVGIDGGGTKTEFVLIDEWGNRLGSTAQNGCNPNTCGIDEAIAIVQRGVELLRPGQVNVAGIFLGGAGFDSGDHAEKLTSTLRSAWPGVRVGCANDIYNVIACSERPEGCIAVIGGTGCAVYSSQAGQVRRYGGLGYRFEGFGSGYDLGREAIRAAVQERDGAGRHTVLTEMVEDRLGGRANDCLQQLYKMDVSVIASFAPLIFKAMRQGDKTAEMIARQSADYVLNLIRIARENAPEVTNVILSGSLYAKSDLFYQMVSQPLEGELTVERMTWKPVWGACLQCARLCGLEQMPSLERFQMNQ